MLTVLEYDKNKVKYKCKCDCGNITYATSTMLLNSEVISCGCSKIKYLPGQKINNIELLERIDSVHWKCRCHCGKEFITMTSNLVKGHTMSCGCQRLERFQATMKERYGEVSYAKVDTDRTPEQLQWVEDEHSFKEFLASNFQHKPDIQELSKIIGVNQTNTLKIVRRFNAEDLVSIGAYFVSSYEREIDRLFPGAITSDRKTLGGSELDLLYEKEKVAIEFNGSYWHSELKTDKNSHYNKQIKCRAKGIRLIHIFEYEWEDDLAKSKILNLIKQSLNRDNSVRVYARKCEIKYIDVDEARKFLNKYHLQNYVKSDVKLGLYYNNELLGVATFGTPRFGSDAQWELLRLCWKPGYQVIGGAEKLLSRFKKDYKPQQILSYCNFAKFDGHVYERLGFKFIEITRPNYVWFNIHNRNIKTRYQQMKKNLVLDGFGKQDETEDQIMNRLGYVKIYDSGYLKYIWSI